MASVNKCTFIGRVVAQPELRYTQGGDAVTSFTLAVDREKRKGADHPECDFIPIVAWQKLAEICSQYLEKGKQIYVEGRLKISNSEKDGKKYKNHDIVIYDMKMLGSKNGSTPAARTAADAYEDIPSTLSDIGMEDDAPF